MDTTAGVGISYHRNPRVAGQEAAEQALKQAGVDKPDFVFMFATVGYDQLALLKAVREQIGGAPLCGCSAGGVIVGDQADELNFSVAVMAISSDELRFINGIATGLKEDSTGVGRAIANTVKSDLNEDALALFLFPDGLTMNFERLRLGLEKELSLDRLLPLLGGTAGDNFEFKRTYQYCNDQVVSDGVAWSLLSGPLQLVYGVNHGCISMGIEHKVTRAEGNVIYEIDRKPALEILGSYLTDDEIVDWGRTLMNFPLGIETTGNMKDDYDSYLIRSLMAKDDDTGAVTIPTEVPEGTSIWMTRRDYRKIADGVDRLAGQIKEQLGHTSAKLVFQFDCAGRGKMILRNQQKLQLLKTLRQRIGSDVPWLGFYTFGEIGPVGEHNYFHNFTAVVTAIY